MTKKIRMIYHLLIFIGRSFCDFNDVYNYVENLSNHAVTPVLIPPLDVHDILLNVKKVCCIILTLLYLVPQSSVFGTIINYYRWTSMS